MSLIAIQLYRLTAENALIQREQLLFIPELCDLTPSSSEIAQVVLSVPALDNLGVGNVIDPLVEAFWKR